MTDTQRIFEQPINERVRSFLRLEKLFDQYDHFSAQDTRWDHPVAIDALAELLAFTTRSDIKLEALKELERQHIKLERLSQRPQVDHGQLSELLQRQSGIIDRLQSSSGQLGQELQSNELLNAIRQKSSVPGCICDFDLPAYQHWLELDPQKRREHLNSWIEPFTILKDAISMILDVMRQSSLDSEEIASDGFFQRSIDSNQVIQLIRIALPVGNDYFPEISAGKHRFSIRFMTNIQTERRPEQYQEDVPFSLSMCNI